MKVTKLLVLICCLVLCGCGIWEWELSGPSGPPYDEEIAESYIQVELRMSDAADVLATIHRPEYELLSQSKSVIASLGQQKKGYETWFNMVAFDENELTARRKYLFFVDERPDFLFLEAKEDLSFDCKMVLESEVLDKLYANENARQVAILKQVLENTRKDIDELDSDNKTIKISGMLINQAFETILVKLDKSPALAARLSDPAGIEFNHINFDKGKIQMVVEDDIVTVKMRLGSLVHTFEIREEGGEDM